MSVTPELEAKVTNRPWKIIFVNLQHIGLFKYQDFKAVVWNIYKWHLVELKYVWETLQ